VIVFYFPWWPLPAEPAGALESIGCCPILYLQTGVEAGWLPGVGLFTQLGPSSPTRGLMAPTGRPRHPPVTLVQVRGPPCGACSGSGS